MTRKKDESEAEYRERRRVATKKWRDANPEKSRDSGRSYYAANREKCLAAASEYRNANREKVRRARMAWYYAEDPEARRNRLYLQRLRAGIRKLNPPTSNYGPSCLVFGSSKP